MTTFEAVEIIEGTENEGDTDHDILIPAWQTLIDSGVVWQLQGFYGRTAKILIESGICKMGSSRVDYGFRS